MDPNKLLLRLRVLMEQARATAKDGTVPEGVRTGLREVTEAFEDLDGWLSRGGHPPQDWKW